MSGSHTTSGVPQPPSDCQQIAAVYRELVELSLGTLGYEVEPIDESSLQVQIPVAGQSAWDDQQAIRIQFEATSETASPSESPPPLLTKLWELVKEKSPAVHGTPADQPTNVHQLTDRIYAPYTVTGGRARLGGCALEPIPFLRLASLDTNQGWQHTYFDQLGNTPQDELIQRLGMRQLATYPSGPASLPREQLLAWIEQTEGARGGTSAHDSSSFPPETVVWCRYASGKLYFEIGEQEVNLNFAGWASEIASGHTPMPPYRCPLSGRESYHLVADDEGRITVAEAIAICEVSGRRVIETDLEICQETGRRALKKYLATCEQTHRRVLKSSLQTCEMCGRRLARVSLVKDRCEACRHLTPVSKDDPTLARLLHQYKKLDAWNRWRIGETQRLFIFTAASWLQRLLLVVDKKSLEVRRMATRGRLVSHWVDAPPKLLEELTA